MFNNKKNALLKKHRIKPEPLPQEEQAKVTNLQEVRKRGYDPDSVDPVVESTRTEAQDNSDTRGNIIPCMNVHTPPMLGDDLFTFTCECCEQDYANNKHTRKKIYLILTYDNKTQEHTYKRLTYKQANNLVTGFVKGFFKHGSIIEVKPKTIIEVGVFNKAPAFNSKYSNQDFIIKTICEDIGIPQYLVHNSRHILCLDERPAPYIFMYHETDRKPVSFIEYVNTGYNYNQWKELQKKK